MGPGTRLECRETRPGAPSQCSGWRGGVGSCARFPRPRFTLGIPFSLLGASRLGQAYRRGGMEGCEGEGGGGEEEEEREEGEGRGGRGRQKGENKEEGFGAEPGSCPLPLTGSFQENLPPPAASASQGWALALGRAAGEASGHGSRPEEAPGLGRDGEGQVPEVLDNRQRVSHAHVPTRK